MHFLGTKAETEDLELATAVYRGKAVNRGTKGKAIKKKKRRSSWFARNFVSFLLAIIFSVGAGLLLYPSFANWWNSTRQSRVLEQYISEIETIDMALAEEQMASALEYNSAMVSKGIMWAMNDEERIAYESELDAGEMGVMGFIEINSIDVKLPIYHGVDESTLARGIGHIEGTSLPVGAKSFDDEKGEVADPEDGSHCVISGHRGLPSSRLFTDLDRMQVGDTFALNIYNNVLIYEVDQIRIVEPSDLSELQLVPGEDYCTMVTCTPYGINTYRIQSNANQIKPAIVAPVMAAPILLAMFIIVMFDPRRKKKKQAEEEEETGMEFNLEYADLALERLDLSKLDVDALLKRKR